MNYIQDSKTHEAMVDKMKSNKTEKVTMNIKDLEEMNCEWFDKAFQKGKLEQKKEELEFLRDISSDLNFFLSNEDSDYGEIEIINDSIKDRLKQLEGVKK